MKELQMFKSQYEKLEEVCSDYGLECSMQKTSYPITFSIWAKNERFEQMQLIADKGKEVKNPFDGRVTFSHENGELVMRVVNGNITMSKSLRSKLESLLMKCINYWQMYFFRQVVTNFSISRDKLPSETVSFEELAEAEPIETIEED